VTRVREDGWPSGLPVGAAEAEVGDLEVVCLGGSRGWGGRGDGGGAEGEEVGGVHPEGIGLVFGVVRELVCRSGCFACRVLLLLCCLSDDREQTEGTEGGLYTYRARVQSPSLPAAHPSGNATV